MPGIGITVLLCRMYRMARLVPFPVTEFRLCSNDYNYS
jgi:hypothetical protein